MNTYLSKTQLGLIPADPPTIEWFNKLKLGQIVRGEFKKVRNYAFLRKYFALLNLAYDNWSPGEINSKYGTPAKNFDRFRADVTILAGYFDITIRLDGSTRVEPKSISFSKMDEESFERLFNSTIDVLLKHVYDRDMDADKLKVLVEQYLSFA